jgi:hypothetical protein
MRRLLLGPLAVCTLAACLLMAPYVRAADLPFAGTWKITVLDSTNELQLWIVKIDKEAKKAEVVAGPQHFGKTKLSDLKADAKAIRCRLVVPPAGKFPSSTYALVAYPVKGKADSLVGSLRAGLSNFVRIKMDKTEDTEIDENKAGKSMAGFADFKAAVQTKNEEERIKALQDVLKDHEGKPITFLTSQLLMAQLVAKKAKADEFKEPAEVYIKQASGFGHEITVGATMTVAQMLTGYEPTHALALTYARKASGLLTEDDPKGVQMAVYLAEALALDKNKKRDDIKPVVEKLAKVSEGIIKDSTKEKKADPFGPTQLVAQMLLNSEVVAVKEMGLKYAEQLPKLLKDDDPTQKKLEAYGILQAGLTAVGKKDEARKWTARIEKLEDQLDKEFAKNNIDFEIEKFTGRKGKSQRAVLVELFTGAQCPPCVSADIAFDAGMKSYKPADVVFLQYHLHIPRPDALTNADSEARSKFYGDDVEGTPTMFIDGKVIRDMGGFKMHGKARYETLREQIDKNLEEGAGAKIKLQVSRKGDKIDMAADVSDVKEKKDAKGNLKLRFVLIEDVVRYVGTNGQRLHHHVVRALPGGAGGIKLEKKEGSHKASVDLGEVRKTLTKYLEDYAAAAKQGGGFPVPGRPMDLKKLKVVAFIQDEESKEVYQAAQAEVEGAAGAKEEKPADKDNGKKEDDKGKKEESKKDKE